MEEFEQIVKTAYWLILGLLFLVIVSRYFYFLKTRKNRIYAHKEKSLFRYFRYATVIMLPVFLFGVISFIFVLQKGNMFASNWLKNGLLLFLGLFLVSEIIYNLIILQKTNNRISNVVFFFLFSLIGIYLTNLFMTAKSHPPLTKSVVIDLPFRGKWIATGAGATGLTNHHDRIASQKYAVDISKIGSNGRLFIGEGLTKEESNTYGADIISPVNGQVVWVVDSLPDSPIKERDKLAGNHIVIKFQDTLYVALAHLQPNSILKKIGDRVAIGESIGKVGMSGNTDFCHLHIHIQDRPEYDIENGIAYPIRFREIKRKRILFWRNLKNEYLLSNDIVEN